MMQGYPIPAKVSAIAHLSVQATVDAIELQFGEVVQVHGDCPLVSRSRIIVASVA